MTSQEIYQKTDITNEVAGLIKRTVEESKQKNSTLNIDILKSKVDNALANETQESLTEWLESQRNKQEPIT